MQSLVALSGQTIAGLPSTRSAWRGSGSKTCSDKYLNSRLPTQIRSREEALICLPRRRRLCVRAASESVDMETFTEKLGIKIQRNPPDSKLSELGVKQWPKWGCSPSKFPWTYSAKETCYLLKGKVKVKPDGAKEAVEIEAGDLVIFPKGMSCTWDVSEAVDKHYKFD